MPIYAVSYQYAEPTEAVQQLRPAHRAWLENLLSQGILLASGPMVNEPSALLIFRSESETELAQLLDLDPFDLGGVLVARTIREWNPVFGPFSS